VGRYYFDDYGPTSVGDNMQKSGISTILIESGEYPGDIERQQVRKLNFIAILSALKGISHGVCKKLDFKKYNKIPKTNDAKLFHLLVRNATIKKQGQEFTIDIGIHLNEINNDDYSDYSIESEIYDIGDLSHYYGYKEINAQGSKIESNDLKSEKNEDFTLNIGDTANFMLTKSGKIEIEIKNGQIHN